MLSAGARAAASRTSLGSSSSSRHGDGSTSPSAAAARISWARNAPDPEELGKTGCASTSATLIAAWQKLRPGAAYVWNLAQLRALDPENARQVLGLFDSSHME